MRGNYDVVIVGAGTAGRLLATRLAGEPGLRVLLLARSSDAGGALPFFARGHRSSYARWPSGWGFFDLLPYFKRSEDAPGHDLVTRGRGGPVSVSPAPEAAAGPVPPSPAFAPFVPPSFPRASDLGGGLEEGAGTVDHAVLADSVAPVIGVVDRLVISGGRVAGVSYRSSEGRPETVSAGEVVLAAGAVGSARLLLASGAGPADDLRAHGIDVIADLPEVGAGLQDHPIATMRFEPAQRSAVSPPHFALLRSRDDLPGPDLRLVWSAAPGGHTWTVEITPAQPRSRGTVRLDAVDPGFYRDERDLDTVVAGLRLARTAFDALGPESVPGPAVDDETQLRAYAVRTVRSAGDAAGTLALGPVVDADLRPHGIEGLRVADASVLPSLPSADITATVCAIAERAADLICGRRHTE